jgi:hypothetical protein
MARKFKVGDRVALQSKCACDACERLMGHVGEITAMSHYHGIELTIGKDVLGNLNESEVEHAPEAAGAPGQADLVTYLNAFGEVAYMAPRGTKVGLLREQLVSDAD